MMLAVAGRVWVVGSAIQPIMIPLLGYGVEGRRRMADGVEGVESGGRRGRR